MNVYIRSDLGDVISQEKYLYSLSQLENILLNFNCNNVIFAGDFNTDPFIGQAWANFKHFLDTNDLVCLDFNKSPSNTFTHVNFGKNNCR